MSLNSLRHHLGVDTLCYMRIGRVEMEDLPNEKQGCQIDGHDWSGSVTILVDNDVSRYLELRPGDPVQAAITPRVWSQETYATVHFVRPLSERELANAGVDLLPRAHCPISAHGALDELHALVKGVETPSIRTLLNRVLSDPGIYPGFLRGRASRSHHHSEVGGLLRHSVSVSQRAIALMPDLTAAERDVTLAAALLHDIGKVRTVGEGGARPLLGRWVHHEALSLELLAPHLRHLDEAWPQGGAWFRHALTFYSVKPRGFARFVGADAIQQCDGIDVAIDMQRWR